jgi:hypothetical protein
MKICNKHVGFNRRYPTVSCLIWTIAEGGPPVRVCTSDIYHDRFTALGVDFYKVGSPFDGDRFNKTIDAVIQIKDPLKSALLNAMNDLQIMQTRPLP